MVVTWITYGHKSMTLGHKKVKYVVFFMGVMETYDNYVI